MSREIYLSKHFVQDPEGGTTAGVLFVPGKSYRVPDEISEASADKAVQSRCGKWVSEDRADAEVDSRPGAEGVGEVESGIAPDAADAERAVAPQEANGGTRAKRTRRAPGRKAAGS